MAISKAKKSPKKKGSVGSGSVRTASGFNLKRALPIIAVMALVGGVVVFKSFAGTAQAEVTKWYRTCLNREPDSEGLAYWSGEVTKLGVNAAALQFAAFTKVSSCPYPDAPKGTASTKVPTGTTATSATNNTANTAATTNIVSDPLKDAQAWTTLGAAHVQNAAKENSLTYEISLRNLITKDNLSEIAQKEGYVRGALSQMNGAKISMQGLYNTAVSNAATKLQGPAILAEIDKVQSQIESLDAYLKNIAADYKRAESTYEANLNYFEKLANIEREKSDCKKAGGTPKFNGECQYPPVAVASSTASAPKSQKCPKGKVYSGKYPDGSPICKSSSKPTNTTKPKYADPIGIDCSAYDLPAVKAVNARHGWYVSCVATNPFSHTTTHLADRLVLTCPVGYGPSAVHTSNNVAGTEGKKWQGRLCEAWFI